MQRLAHEIYSFDAFKLDLTRCALYRGLDEIKLRPKSFDVLKYLAENHGRLVGKHELIDVVWDGVAVTDDSLVQCLKDIRRALNDDSQKIIKTVPRRGYIFEKEVGHEGADVINEAFGVPGAIEESAATNGHRQTAVSDRIELPKTVGSEPVRARVLEALRRHKIAALVAVAMAAGTVVVGAVAARPLLTWWYRPPSIAVMPMLNIAGDPQLDHITDGLTESIITSLVQINAPGAAPRLRVTAQSTVFLFKGKEFDPRSIGQQLGVEYVLTSRMFRQDGLRTFKFELVNVADGSIGWTRQEASGLGNEVGLGDDFLQMQNRIANELAARLPISLSDADRQNLTRRYTQNANAYEAYLKGRDAFRKATTPSSLLRSIEYYQNAIHLDPNFALPFWAMGISCAVQGLVGERPQTEANQKAADLYRMALKIDNGLRPAQMALKLGDLNAWDWAAIEKAGPVHPGYDHWNGGFLIAMGRLDEQLQSEKRRLAFDPYNPSLNFSHATTLFLARRYDDAIDQYHKTLNIRGDGIQYFGPESPWIHVGLGNAYTQKGMYAEAIVEMNKAKDLADDSKGMWASLGYAVAKSGQRDEAIKILDKLLEFEKAGTYVPPLNIAAIYIALDDKDQAFAYLEKAFDDRMDRLRMIKTHPFYDPLRGDPRFAALIRRMGLPT